MLQLNFLVGDFVGNTNKIIAGYKKAVAMGAELVVSTELALFGYPPKDMLLYKSFLDAQNRELEVLKKEIGNIGLIVGIAEINTGDGKPLFNSAVLIKNGKIEIVQRKSLLPTYDVFDESRYFEPGKNLTEIFDIPSSGFFNDCVTILVCEDIWGGNENNQSRKLYQWDPVMELNGLDVNTLIVINGSPYYWGKGDVRFNLVSGISKKLHCNVVYVNQVGGNDDLVFDGRSFAVNENGECIAVAQPFVEEILIVDTDSSKTVEYPSDGQNLKDSESIKNLYQALVLGTHDYVRKNGFEKVVIGLSGGIDSALTACIAVDALGKENVLGVTMPSPFSSQGSVDDSLALAENLGIQIITIPIHDIFRGYGQTLQPIFEGKQLDVTEENIQARIRGNILMALSNKFGYLVLSTGNKSELSVGYCTLYGDMAGGYAVISDQWKTQVYELAKFINREDAQYTIPRNTLEKPPSAELRPDQKDVDSLPPYEILDPILRQYIEEQKGIDEIAIPEMPGGKEIVRKVIDMVNRAEHKRVQMPLGIKTSPKAFGSGRRWPIAAKNL